MYRLSCALKRHCLEIFDCEFFHQTTSSFSGRKLELFQFLWKLFTFKRRAQGYTVQVRIIQSSSGLYSPSRDYTVKVGIIQSKSGLYLQSKSGLYSPDYTVQVRIRKSRIWLNSPGLDRKGRSMQGSHILSQNMTVQARIRDHKTRIKLYSLWWYCTDQD